MGAVYFTPAQSCIKLKRVKNKFKWVDPQHFLTIGSRVRVSRLGPLRSGPRVCAKNDKSKFSFVNDFVWFSYYFPPSGELQWNYTLGNLSSWNWQFWKAVTVCSTFWEDWNETLNSYLDSRSKRRPTVGMNVCLKHNVVSCFDSLSIPGLEIGHFEKKLKVKKLKTQEKKLNNSRKKLKVCSSFTSNCPYKIEF